MYLLSIDDSSTGIAVNKLFKSEKNAMEAASKASLERLADEPKGSVSEEDLVLVRAIGNDDDAFCAGRDVMENYDFHFWIDEISFED